MEEEKNTPVETKKEVSTASNSPENFEFRGKRYQFAKDAPENILFGGESLSQSEILEDETVLIQLIGGNSPLIERI